MSDYLTTHQSLEEIKNYPSADALIRRQLDVDDFIRLFRAAATVHMRKNLANNAYFPLMQAVYANQTALTGILNHIPAHRTGTLALIQEELAERLRPEGEQALIDEKARQYYNRRQQMVPVAVGSNLYQPESVLDFIEALDKLLTKIPAAQRPAQPSQVAHIVNGLFDEIRNRVQYPLPATVDALRPTLLQLEQNITPKNPMLTPQLPLRSTNPTQSLNTFAITASGGGPTDPPHVEHSGPTMPSHLTEEKPKDNPNSEDLHTACQLMKASSAELHTFCTSFQSDKKRKREDDQGDNDQPPTQQEERYCKLCRRKNHTTARCARKCHKCFSIDKQVRFWNQCRKHNPRLKADNQAPAPIITADLKKAISQAVKEAVQQHQEDEVISSRSKAALKGDTN